MGLFDRDEAGISAFKLDKNFQQKDLLTEIKYCTNGMAVGIMMPAPEYRKSCAKYNNLPIEFLFGDEFLSHKIDGKGLELKRMHASRKIGSEIIKIPLVGGTEVHEIDDNSKIYFAEKIVPSYPDDAFVGFKELFNIILEITQQKL